MHGDAALVAWRLVIEAVHAAGGRIVPQLFHQGMLRGGSVADPRLESLRPSGVLGSPGPNSFASGFIDAASVPTRPMAESEIAAVIAAFGRSAAGEIGRAECREGWCRYVSISGVAVP